MSDKKAKGEDKKKKKGKGDKAEKGASGAVSVAAHPVASAQIRTLKGWGGLIGFGAAAALSAKANVPLVSLGARSLAAGVGGYLVAWACGVTVWRALVVAEVRAQTEAHAARLAIKK
jgi:hypothetical protein